MVFLGARQVGKTTLLHQLTADKPDVLSFDCDNMDDREAKNRPFQQVNLHMSPKSSNFAAESYKDAFKL